MLKRFFLTTPAWQIIIAIILTVVVIDYCTGLDSKVYEETTTIAGGTAHKSLSVDNPFSMAAIFGLLFYWLWTLARVLFAQLNRNEQSEKYKRILIGTWLYGCLLSTTMYILAGQIFQSEWAFPALFILMFILIGLYFYCAWRCISLLREVVGPSRFSIFPFGWIAIIYFPLIIWKHQSKIKELYNQQQS